MIKNFSPRLYQQTILGTAARANTLVVLPTGMGKTALAFLLAAQRLHHYPKSKILMLAPTKPLCEQHVESFKNHLNVAEENVVLFTGSVKPEKREILWKDAQVIVSTPQGLENDVINQRVKLQDVSLLIFDEAHHATGEYAYVWIADRYEKTSKYSRILALTASPGSDLETVKEVCSNLKIEKLEVRTDRDPDMKPYIQDVQLNWVPVKFPEEYKIVQKYLKDCRKSKLLEAKGLGFCNDPEARKTDLLRLQGELIKKISSGEKDFDAMRSMSLVAEALKVEHGIEMLECQGVHQCYEYLDGIVKQAATSKTKAVKNLMLDANFKSALYHSQKLVENNVEHPKLTKMKEMLSDITKEKKAIIFTQFRDSASLIVKNLEEMNITAHIFVGQAKKKGIGFSQKKQKEILDQFRNGEFQILVATSVAEEGLDIPKVDEVIFYEPVPSAIRAIQRRGRTGRLEKGEVTVLMTSGTRDEGYKWSAHHKEKRMYRNLDKLKSDFTLVQQQQNKTLDQFIPKNQVVAVVADHREKNNRIVKELIEMGLSVKTEQLVSADYVVSGKVGVELKKIPDFIASIIDRRLLDQMRDLKANFEKSVLIIEGEEDMYSIRKVHANAIRGMLASIALGFNIPILHTKNPKDTAALLAVMAKREQDTGRTYSLHAGKPVSEKEQQEFFISSIPNMGLVNARRLLECFGSIKSVVESSVEDLVKIEGIGKKTAERLVDFFKKEYIIKK
ncbi:DEAD/DEAH box helicase [Candidatus Woesearchaeota archaeon]|jgi:ERCC4-related helicase|nr:DEAD/DEAH box helicase [Candidatus Woesearchaeota archaeon]MBT4150809.1 DEAD/DEAH box helicase [Candidatus Woesearchaeota archaeon]MBT4246914.1 DEAD/DEAH box helicase [Candidatus Woesearchaeota archaeon]MBT4433599.1 DEAD/DEAH box helicase [Candidatus Woesearchaeota archaeon]MBT7332324.1 DEAD/DEAH box helicase [Candidatus Woesearchaeota archaeon]